MIGYSGIFLRNREWVDSDDQALLGMIDQLQGKTHLDPSIVEFNLEGKSKVKVAIIHPRRSFTQKDSDSRSILLIGEHYPRNGTEAILEKILADNTADLHDSIHELNGAFNLLVFDKRTGQLSVFRDRGGVKTCFYHASEGEVIFSSGLRSIAKSTLYRNKGIDKQGLWMNLAYPAPPQPLTCFKEVRCLERGARLDMNQNCTVQPFWQIPSREIDTSMSFDRAKEEVHRTLSESTQSRVNELNTIGSTLSGGVDSAYLSVLAHQQNAKTEAFTFKLKGDQFSALNEDDVASLTAEKYGLKHHIKEFEYDDFMEDFQTLIKLYEQPGISIGAYYSIAKLGDQLGFEHVVNGLAGDELFGGFHFFKHLGYWPLLRLLNPIAALLPSNRSKGIDKFIKISGAASIDEYYSRAFAIYLDKELKNVFNGFDFDALETLKSCYNPKSEKFVDSTSGLMHYMFSNCPNHHIYRFETFSNHFGIQPLYPFLDNAVIDHAFRIPSKHKVQGHRRKIVLKQAAAAHVVQPALTENKRGVGAPVNSWMNSFLRDIKEEKLKSLKERDLFNASYIDRISKEYPAGYGKKIWKLVMTELWLEEFID